MSCLSDRDIISEHEKHGLILPFSEELVQPASYELTLDGSRVYRANPQYSGFYDVSQRNFMRYMTEDEDPNDITHATWIDTTTTEGVVVINPGEFYIASSKEYLSIPPHLMSRFEGKSTLGRVGLMVHITAGYVDPGFRGTLTLEVANVAPWPIVLRDGDKIGQLSFHFMSCTPDNLYGEAGNHYQGQVGPTLPR